MKTYRISGIDATCSPSPKDIGYDLFEITSDDGEWKEFNFWGYFYCSPKDLKESVELWLRKHGNRNDVCFSVVEAKNPNNVVFTEEDLYSEPNPNIRLTKLPESTCDGCE
jgi:hypothetical protein